MAETKTSQKATYPLPAYNFRVTIDGQSMGFSQVSGISIEYESVTYKHGLSFWEGERIKKYHYDKYTPITLKRGTVIGINFLYDWLKDKQVRPLEVSLCNEAGEPLVSWRVAKALPVKLEAPTFDAETNDVSIESLEVMAAGISVIHH